jgi:hypothetical protein
MTSQQPEVGQPVELYGPEDGGWYRTAVMDWIALCEKLRDVDVRGYLVLRSLVGDKWAHPVRKLTLEELCGLIPSPSGGPSGLSRVRELLSSLTKIGLVTTPDGAPLKTTSRKSGAAKPLRIRVNEQAPEGYQGWRNAADKLAGARTARSKETGGAERPAAGRKPDPGAKPSRKSDPSGRKSSPQGRKSSPENHPDQQECAPISPLSTNFPPSCSASAPAGVPTQRDQWVRREQRDDDLVETVVTAWARGAGRARLPASVYTRLSAQVPDLLSEFTVPEALAIAVFAGGRRWVDLGRAALHPACEASLSAAGVSAHRAGHTGRGGDERDVLLSEIGLTGTGL